MDLIKLCTQILLLVRRDTERESRLWAYSLSHLDRERHGTAHQNIWWSAFRLSKKKVHYFRMESQRIKWLRRGNTMERRELTLIDDWSKQAMPSNYLSWKQTVWSLDLNPSTVSHNGFTARRWSTRFSLSFTQLHLRLCHGENTPYSMTTTCNLAKVQKAKFSHIDPCKFNDIPWWRSTRLKACRIN